VIIIIRTQFLINKHYNTSSNVAKQLAAIIMTFVINLTSYGVPKSNVRSDNSNTMILFSNCVCNETISKRVFN